MSDPLRPTRWLHRFAVATCCAALLPISIGAVVTTMKWGMAFHDWPSSDGHGMFAYPWFGSAIDKFTEHAHRLAGITIGCFSIVLTAWSWHSESRRWVCWLATAVLGGVILQGLLGGGRVLANDPRMALVHGQFAACVLALMGTVALVTSQNWKGVTGQHPPAPSPQLKTLAWTLPAVLLVQSALGGWIRHLGGGLLEHVGFALVVLLLAACVIVLALRHGARWLKQNAWILAGVLLLQLGQGLAIDGCYFRVGNPGRHQRFIVGYRTLVRPRLLQISIISNGLKLQRHGIQIKTHIWPPRSVPGTEHICNRQVSSAEFHVEHFGWI